ncbi:MAG: hypothetical protein HYY82_12175 [Deltaproteobacteria bacterium]|nr:hypothetical protein [Deltaproteobacteria bacterium]
MRGIGPRYERETIIRFDEDSQDADIWTASETVYRRLLKRGYKPYEDEQRHAAFRMPRAEIKLPRPKRKASPEHAARLKQARSSRQGLVEIEADGANGADKGLAKG